MDARWVKDALTEAALAGGIPRRRAELLDPHMMRAPTVTERLEDMRASAEQIYGRLAEGGMPCDGRWPADHVQRFRTWIDTGCAP